MKNHVGVLSIQGLPPRHGAFEQTVDQIVKHAASIAPDLIFFVCSSTKISDEPYDLSNVKRIFFRRKEGFGVITYGLKAFFFMYLRGVRTFLVMGYGLAIFFWLFNLLGCKLVCNVDGFEWRRAKWGKWARRYFKLCESASVVSNAELIFDSEVIARYYKINHRRSGHTIFYGAEPLSGVKISKDQLFVGGSEYFIVVMRMEPENHILEIVKAYLASNSRRRLILVGPSTPFFEKAVKPLINSDLTAKVIWLGPIYDRSKLQVLRKNAYAYIHGHSVGGTNPTLVEACLLGKPIIAYRSTFNREVLGVNALYFWDESSLISIFRDDNPFINTPPNLDKRYTWDYICNEYIKLLS